MDTIVAISTAVGEGAIAIIRLSGDRSFEIASKYIVSGRKAVDFLSSPRQMTYGHFFGEDGKVIDEIMAVGLKAPKTYTREDMVEIYCHGGIVSVEHIFQTLLKGGCRPAQRGEFTLRAFLSGRIDLTQAESVIDLVQAKTKKTFDVAMQQLSGGLSHEVKKIRSRLIDVLASIDVAIDYPEEDIEEITYSQMMQALSEVHTDLLRLLSTSETGRILREGLKVVILGKPNVGKSSLLNFLLGEERAIVTDIAGTTRDTLEESLSLDGVPLHIIDTAGIRETEDLVEKIGVEKAKRTFNEADLSIFVFSCAEPLSSQDLELMDMVDTASLVIVNKVDAPHADFNREKIRELVDKGVLSENRIVYTSISQGINVDAIKVELKKIATNFGGADELGAGGYASILTNARHVDSVRRASELIETSMENVERSLEYDLIEIDIRNAVEVLGSITGETASENLIDTIFSRFCLGK